MSYLIIECIRIGHKVLSEGLCGSSKVINARPHPVNELIACSKHHLHCIEICNVSGVDPPHHTMSECVLHCLIILFLYRCQIDCHALSKEELKKGCTHSSKHVKPLLVARESGSPFNICSIFTNYLDSMEEMDHPLHQYCHSCLCPLY